jgi:hypothetical protein
MKAMCAEEHKWRILENLQAVGLEIATDTIEGIPATVAHGIARREYDSAMKTLLAVITFFTWQKAHSGYTVYFYVPIVEIENLTVSVLSISPIQV